jgi:glycerophosphoryl diester phosphodiesterase
MLIYGHGTTEPENRINSRESFVAVRRLGVDGVELDVRLSQDGELLVIHDHYFEDGRAVAETSSPERPGDIIDLALALDLCKGLIVNIEIKNYPSDPAYDPSERISARVLDLLDSRGNADRVLISCFGVGSLNYIRARRPELATAHLVLSRRPAEEVVRICVDHGHRVIHPYVSMVDAAFMKVARDHDLTVNVWTGFDETDESLEALISLEVDGVITGFPERALRCRAKRAR